MNNHIKNIVLLLVFSGVAISATAQQGFGTNTPAASAVVDMTASNKGVLLPRVTLTGTADIATVPSAAPNLLVFNTATAGDVTPGFYCWNSTSHTWIRLLNNGDNTGGWTLTGNSSTDPTKNFVGTTDAQDLAFKTGATERMRMTSGGNIGVGTSAPNSSALLDVTSTTQGFLPPRMTSAQIAAIASPVEGLIVYNTTLQCLAYYAKGGFTCAFTAPVTPPVASNVTVSGSNWIGSILTSSYSYSQSEGVAAGTPSYQWYYATASDGTGKTTLSGATSGTYTLAAPAMGGTYVAVGVTPVTVAGTAGVRVLSPWSVVSNNTAPYFTNLTITAGTNVGSLATISYTAQDDDNDPLGATSIQWYRFTDTAGTGKIAIAGATSATYTFTTADVGYYINAGAIATATSGATPGTEHMASTYVGPVVNCGGTMIVTHTAGAVAPVSKTVTYGTVYAAGGNDYQCWITQNLGADHQASAISDATDASAGWYWQYNRSQGYAINNGVLTPSVYSNTADPVTSDWGSATDPCTLLLGTPWHLAGSVDFLNLLGGPGGSSYTFIWDGPLKLHKAGIYMNTNIGMNNSRGTYGVVWVRDGWSIYPGVDLAPQIDSSFPGELRIWAGPNTPEEAAPIRCVK